LPREQFRIWPTLARRVRRGAQAQPPQRAIGAARAAILIFAGWLHAMLRGLVAGEPRCALVIGDTNAAREFQRFAFAGASLSEIAVRAPCAFHVASTIFPNGHRAIDRSQATLGIALQ
jgi:hypothetical protein